MKDRIIIARQTLCNAAGCTARPDFADPCASCPEGHWGPYIRKGCPEVAEEKPRGLGDIIERMVKPIAKALRLNCLDENANLKPKSPCAKRRDALNKLTP